MLRPRERCGVPKVTQHGVESQGRSPGLRTPASVLSVMQVACARFSRALSPLSGVELIRMTHIQTFSCTTARISFLGYAELKAERCREPKGLSSGWGGRGAVGEKEAAEQGWPNLDITARGEVTGSSLLPCHPSVPPASQSTGQRTPHSLAHRDTGDGVGAEPE